jgi:hypothetical protein
MKKTERPPRTLKIEAQWEDAAKRAITKAKPPSGWPKPEASKRAPTGGPKHASRLQPKQQQRPKK